VVLSTATRSFACGDDVTAGLAFARRASLMGRSEGIPHAEFLAHLALVRARRRAGQPHLGLRIARALRGVVTAPWLPWLDWEAVWTGGAPPELPRPPDGCGATAGRSLRAMLEAAAAGERSGYEAARDDVRSACKGLPLFERELADLTTCMDASDPDA